MSPLPGAEAGKGRRHRQLFADLLDLALRQLVFEVHLERRKLRGAPSGHVVNIREVRLAAGAEFVVMICGDIMTMPGLPKVPSANKIDLVDGKVVGLF